MEGEHAYWNALYPLPAGVIRAAFRLLLHVLPIWGGVLYFPGDEGFSLSRDHKSDTGVCIQGIPQHVTQEAKESKKGKHENDDDKSED